MQKDAVSIAEVGIQVLQFRLIDTGKWFRCELLVRASSKV